jgi:S1-C subfamily serine protease
MTPRTWQLAWLLILCVPALARADKPPRYSALMTAGQRMTGEKLADWHDKGAVPKLEAQPLLDAGNPVRWLRDRSLPQPAMPAAYVEMHTGDRLPGMVVDYRTGKEQPFLPLPPHLLVTPHQQLEPPRKAETAEIRVTLSSVRRVVWQRRSRQSYQPSTAFFRDGRSVAFRAIRFGSGHVSLLIGTENRKVPWSDLAEVHLQKVPFWPAYFDDMADLCSTSETRLLQVEAISGLVATTSVDRFTQRTMGNPADSNQWVHGIQPAWSLDVLWIPSKDISCRRFFLPREVPLVRVPYEVESGRGKTVRLSQNAFGGPLRNTTLDFGWGFGLLGPTEMKFELPPGVKSFRSQVGLDRVSGKGGCVRARVFANAIGTPPLWESPFLVGSEAIADTGVLPLTGPAVGQKHLVLQIDAAHDGRPAGTDPLDIRDHADWFDPMLELDPAMVKTEFDKRIGRRFFAWQDANVRMEAAAAASTDVGPEILQNRNEQFAMPGSFDQAIGPKGRAIVISKQLQLTPQDQWLIIGATRPINRGPEPKIEVRIGNEPVAEFTAPLVQNDRMEARPLAFPLANYQKPGGALLDVEIRHAVQADAAPISWYTIEAAPQLPTLYCAFEEQARFTPHGGNASGSASLVEDDKHFGQRSARLTPAGRFMISFPTSVAIREKPKWGEFRFLRFAFRKKGGGRLSLELETTPPRMEAARYDGGQGEKSYGSALRLWQDKLPDQWIVLTRDLFADFGSLDVTAISLGCPDGEAALFDHIYFARSPDDYNLIPSAPSPDITNQKAKQELAKQIVDRTAPAMVTIAMPDGRIIGGVCLKKEGEILTAGHLLRGPNQDVVVQFASGKQAKGKTLGISRELNLGLVKVTDAGDWPFVPLWPQKEVDVKDWYIAYTYPAKLAGGTRPEMKIAEMRRFFRNTLWMDVEQPEWTGGGALVNKHGYVVGVHLRRSQFGGFLYTRLGQPDLQPHFDRMLKGEVFGAWPAGSEPMLGLAGKPTLEGYELAALPADSAAAKAGLKIGDRVTRIDTKPVVGPDDVQLALAEKDAGQEVTIEISRASATQQVKAILAPRAP